MTATNTCAKRSSSGAAGVVVEHPCPGAGRLQVVVPDARAAHARICQALSGNPSQNLTTLGITGNHGKSITSAMVRSILEAAGNQFGLIGSSGFSDGTKTRLLGAGFDHPKATLAGVAAPLRVPIADLARVPGGPALGAARLATLLAETGRSRLQGSGHRSLELRTRNS